MTIWTHNKLEPDELSFVFNTGANMSCASSVTRFGELLHKVSKF